MNNNLFFAVYAASACLTTYSAQAQDLVVGYENKPFDSPEGWTMAPNKAPTKCAIAIKSSIRFNLNGFYPKHTVGFKTAEKL